MTSDKQVWRRFAGALMGLCVTSVLLGATLTLTACGATNGQAGDSAAAAGEGEASDQGEDAASAGEESGAASDGGASEGAEAAPEGDGSLADESADATYIPEGEEGDVSADSWAAECLDAEGNVTAYAVSELKGWQLETLLLQHEYSWNTRNQLWANADGSVALVVLDAKGEELSDDKIAGLDQGSLEDTAAYRIVTSAYSTPQKAFDALVAKVMVVEDSEFAEDSGVAVCYGPSSQRSLVFVSTSNNVVLVSLYGEDAIKSGIFNEEAGRDLGGSVGETFQTLTGRAPGEEAK